METFEGALDVALHGHAQPPYRGRGPSFSMLGVCRRQFAYALAGFPFTPEVGVKAAADVGTLLHLALLPRLATQLGGECERRSTWNIVGVDGEAWLSIPGTVDLLACGAAYDLKTVSDRVWGIVREPSRAWRFQVTAGALAHSLDAASIIVLNRDTGEVRVWAVDVAEVEPDLRRWVGDAARDPQDVPRDHRGPGIDRACDDCPFLAECWPGQPKGDPQSVLAADDPAREIALTNYDKARTAASDAEADVKFWRAVLTGSPPSTYGGWRLSWSQRTNTTLDKDEARRLLDEAGLPVPVKTSTSTSIGVKRA